MTETSSGLIYTEVVGEICHVTLSAPEKLNAVDHDMVVALRDTCAPIFKDANVKVVVFRGAGRGFCAGFAHEGICSISHNSQAALMKRWIISCSPSMTFWNSWAPVTRL